MTDKSTVIADSISTGRLNGRTLKAGLPSVIAGTVGMTTGVRMGSHVVSVAGHSKVFDASAKITARGHGGAHRCTATHLLESTCANFSMQTSLFNSGGAHNLRTNVQMSVCGVHSCVKTVRVGNMDE